MARSHEVCGNTSQDNPRIEINAYLKNVSFYSEWFWASLPEDPSPCEVADTRRAWQSFPVSLQRGSGDCVTGYHHARAVSDVQMGR